MIDGSPASCVFLIKSLKVVRFKSPHSKREYKHSRVCCDAYRVYRVLASIKRATLALIVQLDYLGNVHACDDVEYTGGKVLLFLYVYDKFMFMYVPLLVGLSYAQPTHPLTGVFG
jgi:hypothetical protein